METVVIDANVALALVIKLPYSDAAEARVSDWRTNQTLVSVPSLWWYEVTSSLRQAVTADYLESDDVDAALEDLSALGIKTFEPTLALQRRALVWAERLKQSVAYDAQYLALAEQLGAEFWTADNKLALMAHKVDADWVRLIEGR